MAGTKIYGQSKLEKLHSYKSKEKKTVYYVVAYLPELCLDTSLCLLTLNNLNPPLNVQEKMLRESRK